MWPFVVVVAAAAVGEEGLSFQDFWTFRLCGERREKYKGKKAGEVSRDLKKRRRRRRRRRKKKKKKEESRRRRRKKKEEDLQFTEKGIARGGSCSGAGGRRRF